jgi:hypothetical protein
MPVEAAEIRRRLAEAAPDAYLPDLASSLNNLAIRLSEVGRRAEALAPATEAPAKLWKTATAVGLVFGSNSQLRPPTHHSE